MAPWAAAAWPLHRRKGGRIQGPGTTLIWAKRTFWVRFSVWVGSVALGLRIDAPWLAFVHRG